MLRPNLKMAPTGTPWKQEVIDISSDSDNDGQNDKMGPLSSINPNINSMPETNLILGPFSLVNVKSHHSKRDKPDAKYPVRGKGARWKKNSCAIDCCLVALQLLEVASPSTESGICSRLEMLDGDDPLQIALINAIDHDWNKKPWDSSKVRNEVWWQYVGRLNAGKLANAGELEVGHRMAATAVWNSFVSEVDQFSFRFQYHQSCTSCNKLPDSHLQISKSIQPDTGNADAETGVTMQEMLQNHFDSKITDHKSCSGVGALKTRRVIEGSLPLQLVIYPSPTHPNIRGATSDRIQFSYLSSTLGEQQVAYRWLGGIYRIFLGEMKESNAHFSLYWTDTARSHPSSNVKIYDGLEFRGRIVGGIPPDKLEDKVPLMWADGTSVLFYEQVGCGSHVISSLKRRLDADDDKVEVPALKKRKT